MKIYFMILRIPHELIFAVCGGKYCLLSPISTDADLTQYKPNHANNQSEDGTTSSSSKYRLYSGTINDQAWV